MKKGCHRFLLVGVIVFCLLFGAGSLIYAEEDPNTNETDPVLQVQEEVGQTIEDIEPVEEGEQIEASDQYEDQVAEDMRVLPALPPELNVKTVKSGISYDIVLTNVPKDGFDFIVFKVWSSKNGEDDVKVYPAKWQKDGSCKCRVLINDHKHLGDYQVVAYGVNSTETTVIDSADQITAPLLKDEDIATKIENTSFETPVPQNGKVSVSTNYAKGTFAVKVTGIQNPGFVQRVRFAVWSKSDKSDRVWYEGTKQTNGSYTASGSIAKHNYNAGTYQIYAYAIDTKGESRLQSKTTADLNAKYTVSIKSYKVTISGLKYPGGFKTVWVPSWSDKKGQDDLKWYQAVKQTNGCYVATLKAGNYKHFGLYHNNFYVRLSNGKDKCIGSKTFTVYEPTGIVSKASVNINRGTFKAGFIGVKRNTRIKKVRIYVWSKADKSDRKSYKFDRNKTASYSATVNLKDYKNRPGTYHIAVYTTDTKNDSKCHGEVTVSMLATTSSLKVTVPAATPASRTLTATGVKAPCGIKNVKFAVWSAENGQDDLKWYTAKASGSTYTCTMDVRSHKSAGEFNVYAYVWCKYGTRRCTKKATFDASGSASGSSAISGISNTTGNHNGTFKITSTVKSDGELDTVKYQVYSNTDKSDSYIYTAKSTDSTYSATANVKNHKYHFGTYTVETYGYLANGAYFTLEPVTCTLKPYYYVYATLNSAKDQAKITLVHNTSTGISSVQFPSWSTTNGQDDIIWYEGTKGSGNTWTTTVYGVSHKDAGSFRTDVYLNGSTSAAVANVTYTLKATTGFTGRRKGIDVSKWNGDIKWAKVKGAGIKYAIIRCGYGDNIKAQDDSKWAYNVSQCEKLGIPYGVYIYSYATTVKEAQSEADHCIRLLKGHSPKYPVYLDLEDSCMANLSNAKLASITQAWATKIKSAGYKPGVYSSKSWWTNRLTSSVFNNYQKWVAQWNTRCTYTGTYQMWQYSSEGKVSGISGNVDMNYAY